MGVIVHSAEQHLHAQELYGFLDMASVRQQLQLLHQIYTEEELSPKRLVNTPHLESLLQNEVTADLPCCGCSHICLVQLSH